MPAADPIFEVAGHEVANTFAHTIEVVALSTRGIAIDDGSGICPVLWNATASPPSMGGRATVTGEELVGHHSGVFIAQSP